LLEAVFYSANTYLLKTAIRLKERNMRKRRGRAGIILVATLLAALLFSTAEAANGLISARLTVNKGKLRLIPLQGKDVIYGNGETDLLLAPQTILKSLDGTSIIKIGQAEFILDENDTLAYESERDSLFRCMNGSIEAISGDRTCKLGQGEVMALNSLSEFEGAGGWTPAYRARLSEQRFLVPTGGPDEIKLPKTTPSDPFQSGPYNLRWPWLIEYSDSQHNWANVSPYW
jgi:hypothetical protein